MDRAVAHPPAAGLEDAEKGGDVVRRVGEIEADIDARPDAQLLEARRGAVRRFLVVAEGHDLVEEVGERPVGVLRAALLEDLVDRLLWNLELPLHARRIALFPDIARHAFVPPGADTMTRDRRSDRPSRS